MCMGGLDWDDLEEKEEAQRQGGEAGQKSSELPPLAVLSWCVAQDSPDDSTRHQQICDAVGATGAHLICLQGYAGLQQGELVGVYRERLEALGLEHEEIGHGPRASTGVSLLWRADSVRLSLRGELRVHGAPTDRAAVLLVLRDARAGEYGPRLAVVAAQLGDLPAAQQQQGGAGAGGPEDLEAQLRAVLEALGTNLAHISSVPVLLCLSAPGSASAAADALMGDFGFLPVWGPSKEQAKQVEEMTTHIWVRGPLDPCDAAPQPEAAAEQSQAAEAGAEGTKPAPMAWRELSSHQPVLATFKWPAGN